MQGNAAQKKQHEATVAALTSNQPPPPPPHGGGVIASAQGLRPGSSADTVDTPMTVAPDMLSHFARKLMQHVKPLLGVEEVTDRRKKNAPTHMLHLSEGGKRRGEVHKALTSMFRFSEFNRKRLAIETQAEGFKHKVEPQPTPPPESGGASSTPDHVHQPVETGKIKRTPGVIKRLASTKRKSKFGKSTLRDSKPVVQGTVVPKRRGARVIQGRPVGRLPLSIGGCRVHNIFLFTS